MSRDNPSDYSIQVWLAQIESVLVRIAEALEVSAELENDNSDDGGLVNW